MQFFSEVKQLKQELENLGFKVFSPDEEGPGTNYAILNKEERGNVKQSFINQHIKKIKDSDAVLVANYTKNDIANYIGANSFLEMAFAYVLEKKIFILNGIPDQTNTVEIEGLKPICLNGDLSYLKVYAEEN